MTIIDLVEGTRRTVELAAADGPDTVESGGEHPRRLALQVVRLVGGAALLDYGPHGALR